MPQYEPQYLALLDERGVGSTLHRVFVGAALLCVEPKPERCHRRLAAGYLAQQWGGFSVVHL